MQNNPELHSSNRPLALIALCVLAMHATLLIFAAQYWDFTPVAPKAAKPERLVVKTIALNQKPLEKPLPHKIVSLPEEFTPPAPKASVPETPLPEPESIPPPQPKALEPEPVIAKKTEEIAVVEAKPELLPLPEPLPEPIAESKSEPLAEIIPPKPLPVIKPIAKSKPKEKKAEAKPVIKKESKPIAAPKPTPPPAPIAPVKKPPEKKIAPSSKPKIEAKKPDPKEEAAKEAAKESARVKKLQQEADQVKQRAAEKRAAEKARQQALASARENMARIDKNRDIIQTSKTAELSDSKIGSIERLQVEAFLESSGQQFSSQERSYHQELISRLKLQLKLPDYGEVKVKLTLERSGRVAKVSVIAAESSKNRAYIEKKLPDMNYPSFGSNFPEHSQYTFVLVLSNDL